MTTPPDSLLALRNAIKSSSPITYASSDASPTASLASATHLVLSPTVSFPKSSPTRYLKPGSTTEFFTLDAIYLAWLLRDAPGAEYMKQARENGLALGFVSVTERKSVVEWLEGRATENERIIPLNVESTTPPGSPQPSSSKLYPTSTPRKAGVETSDNVSASPTKRRYIADAADVEVVKKIKANEIELRDRTTVLHGVKPNNFSSIRSVYTEKLKRIREVSKPGAAQVAAPVLDPKMQARKARNMYPIIMISSSPTALITMHNVKRFLQESVFEPSADARARATAEGNSRPEDMIAIYRKLTTIDPSGREHTTHTRYFVVDSVDALSKFGGEPWERVVCVMTTGQAWQFRPYKWQEPRELFHHVKGIYVSWSNDPPNPKIKDWNVTELKIDPHRRHVDKAVLAHLWKTLDTWTAVNKPWLVKS
ncbi:hypothetical protein PLICRDRAFT_109795 [Plicaturopsis crispa FD-325 SS-3]|nr:hypothetical protein PLICRDRAFT_109795 [Plicaturopsis crispa FD-325 SS-3]